MKELNLDVRDPFTNLIANACALADMVDELRQQAVRPEAGWRKVDYGSPSGAWPGDTFYFIDGDRQRWALDIPLLPQKSR